MSLSSSPRIPNSVTDIPRRRPKERKRQDLRSYYGIESSVAGNSALHNQGPVGHNPDLDRDDFQLDEYVAKVNQTPGAKELLKIENELVKEIRVLNGERKALIYDNYGRILTISETIKQLRLRLDAMSVSWGDFESILHSVRKLSTVSGATEPAVEQDELITAQSAEDLTRQWLQEATIRISSLTAFEQYAAALDEVADVEAVLEQSGDALLDPDTAQQLKHSLRSEREQIQERLEEGKQEKQEQAPSVPAKD
ncbi:Vps51/Vps67-domain-containing protein [Protomyces lactucae-debilis]|uniref:Vacuolar protein sorting-associated protein 51 homolog n=1 Tax=Protomyces lactucae-debilis TaxID=2754530 RepID=A0A1Y2FH81_PROLT|nr:Vps51/Vps67-domain-containing protein [Protomyces lactucae-debilis]ORY83283.1 Vps51/Vps67-domain-containing protein [Protomyces lactucae-debilis]